MSFIVLGDPHIGKGTSIGKQFVGSSINSRIIDQMNLLDFVYKKALEKMVSAIVITGDVFDDPKPHYSFIRLLMDWAKKCSAQGIYLHIIAGNHDMLRSGQLHTSPLDIISDAEIDNVNVYKSITTINIDNDYITLVPFRDRRSLNLNSNAEAIRSFDNKFLYENTSIPLTANKIMIGHLAIEGSIPIASEIDDMQNEIFIPLESFKDYDYVWMGHIHKFQVMSSKPHIAHIGSMDISDFGEANQSKYLVHFSDKIDGNFEYIKAPTRKLTDLKISVPDDIDDVNQYILDAISESDQLENCILKLTVSLPNHISLNRDFLEKKINDMKVFHLFKMSEEKRINKIKNKLEMIDDDSITEDRALDIYASMLEDIDKDLFISEAKLIIKESAIK